MKMIVWTVDASIFTGFLGKWWNHNFCETSNPILGETKGTDSWKIVGKSKERKEKGEGFHPVGLTYTDALEHKLFLGIWMIAEYSINLQYLLFHKCTHSTPLCKLLSIIVLHSTEFRNLWIYNLMKSTSKNIKSYTAVILWQHIKKNEIIFLFSWMCLLSVECGQKLTFLNPCHNRELIHLTSQMIEGKTLDILPLSQAWVKPLDPVVPERSENE